MTNTVKAQVEAKLKEVGVYCTNASFNSSVDSWAAFFAKQAATRQ